VVEPLEPQGLTISESIYYCILFFNVVFREFSLRISVLLYHPFFVAGITPNSQSSRRNPMTMHGRFLKAELLARNQRDVCRHHTETRRTPKRVQDWVTGKSQPASHEFGAQY